MARQTVRTLLIFHIIYLLFWQMSQCKPTSRVIEFDVDHGKADLFEVNEGAGLDLYEGDILYDEEHMRNSLIGDQYRWPKTIPYYLGDDLAINAKGVILKAFEQYRLKTCIDYKPWSGEKNYISVFKGGGCFSSVGNQNVGAQRLSIGIGCDRIATIEHEFLHALGFWHEQSRADRDDYVQIMWDRISAGKEHNFNTYNDSRSSALNVPYDYGSMMHYSKNAFRNGTEPTIVTKIPAFSDVIGQRMEFSDNDLLKLSRLYNCSRSTTFLDSCDFERENICGMIQGPGDQADWVHVTKATGGPSTDYTNLGRCSGQGFLMHFSTAAGAAGDKARLETRLLYPRRGYQCLQFFLYNSGHASDRLSILVREYEKSGPNSTLRFIQEIDGPPQDQWQLYHVSLAVSKKFRVVFEGTKGPGPSSGGLSLDDINLSETACPDHVWRVRNFSNLMENTPQGVAIYSPRFRSKYGYTFQMGLYPNGSEEYPGELGAYAHLASGDDATDAGLTWPSRWMQMTMMLMDQNGDIRKRMSNQRSVTTEPNKTIAGTDQLFWDDPRKVGTEESEDGVKYFRGPGAGTPLYLTQARARSRDFIKGGDAIFLLTMEDIAHLVPSQPLPPTTTALPITTDPVKPVTTDFTSAPPTGTSPSAPPTTTTPPAPPTTPTPSSPPTTPTPSAPPTKTTPSVPPTTPTPSAPTTTITITPPDMCETVVCENDGVCVVDSQDQAVCRCAVGDDWWYTGDRCQFRGSTQDAIITAVTASVCVLAVMLIVTATIVVCLRRKYKREMGNMNGSIIMQNVSVFSKGHPNA